MTTRRNILKMLGLSPLAAKVAADSKILSLSGIDENRTPVFASGGYGDYPPSQSTASTMSYEDIQIAAQHYAETIGIPDFIKSRIKRDSQYVNALDPDIAAKKSWSVSVKVLTQRERNYQRSIDGMISQFKSIKTRSAFRSLTGWDWPW